MSRAPSAMTPSSKSCLTRRLKYGQALAVFDPALLSPLGDIKPAEQVA